MSSLRDVDHLAELSRQSGQAGVRFDQSPLRDRSVYKKVTSAFLIAYCAQNNEVYNGWLSIQGLVAMAEHVFLNGPEYESLSKETQLAFFYGALTAIWIVPASSTFDNEEIDKARSLVLSKLRATPPNIEMIRVALRYFADNLKNPDNEAKHIKLVHWFPLQLCANITEANITSLLESCKESTEEKLIEFSDDILNSFASPKNDSDICRIWPTLSDNEIVAFFNIVGLANNTSELDYISAVFTMTLNISHTAFKEQWISRRWRNLQRDMPELVEVEQVHRDVLIEYGKIFRRIDSTLEYKVSGLVANYKLAHHAGLESVKRIIYQAQAPYVSCLTALCDLSLKYSTITYTILSYRFGSGQVRSVIYLAATVIHNPYITLEGIPLPVYFFSDIAFLAELMFNMKSGNQRRNSRHISDIEKSIRKPKIFLQAFAGGLDAIQRNAAETGNTEAALLKAYNYKITGSDGDNLYISPLVSNDNQSDESRQESDLIIKRSKFIDFLISIRNEKDKAFTVIMEALSENFKLHMLPLVESVEAGQPQEDLITKIMPDSVKNALNIHDFTTTINSEWNTNLTLILNNNYRMPTKPKLAGVHRTSNSSTQ